MTISAVKKRLIRRKRNETNDKNFQVPLISKEKQVSKKCMCRGERERTRWGEGEREINNKCRDCYLHLVFCKFKTDQNGFRV